MKRVIIYSLVGILTASLSGAATYAFAYQSSNNGGVTTSENSTTSEEGYGPSYYDPDAGEVPTGIGGLMYNLTSKGDMSIKNLSVTLDGTIGGKKTDTMVLGFSDGNVDYSDTSALKLKSTLSVQYGSSTDFLSTSMNIDYESGDYAYMSFVDGANKTQRLMAKAPTNISGITTLLSGIVSTPDFDTDGLLSSLNDLVPSLTSALNEDEVNKNKTTTQDGGFLFPISFGNMDIPVGTKTISIKNLNVVLGCDSNYYFNYFGLNNDEKINVSVADTNGGSSTASINVGLKGTFSLAKDSTFVGLGETEKAQYTDISNVYTTANSLCETIADIANKTVDGTDNPNYRKFNSGLTIKATYPLTDEHELDLTGSLNGDLSSIVSKDDFDKGVFELDLTKSFPASNKKSEGTVLYKNGYSYVKLNDAIKGKISNTSISSIVSLASDFTKEPTEADLVTAKVSSVLSLSAIIAQAKENPYVIGEYIPSSLVSGFTYSPTYISFGLNGKALGMDDKVMNIKINTSEKGVFQSFAIEDISVGGIVIDLGLTIGAGSIFTLDPTSTTFEDYSCVSSLFATASDFYHTFAHDKEGASNTFGLAYEVNIASSASKKGYIASGEINGDTTGLDINDLSQSDYGKYHLSAKVEDKTRSQSHQVDAYYQDKNIYFATLSGVAKNSISNATTSKFVDLVSSKSSGSSSIDSMQEAMDVVDELLGDGAAKADLYSMLEGDFTNLGNYFSLTNGETTDSLVLTLNLKALMADSAKLSSICAKLDSVKLTLDTADNSLKDIKVSGLSYFNAGAQKDNAGDDFSLAADVVISLKDQTSYTGLTSEETATYVGVDNAVNAFINLPNEAKQFEVGLDGSFSNVSLDGFANVDRTVTTDSLSTPEAKGQLNIHETYDTSKVQDHQINFQYLGSGTNVTDAQGKDRSYLGYIPEEGMSTADYNGNIHLRLHNSSVFDIVDDISNTSDSNLLNPANLLAHYSQTTSEIVGGLSISDIIANKAYLALLDGYILKAQVTASQIVLQINPGLFDGSIDYTKEFTGTPYSLTIDYENTAASGAEANYSVTGAHLTGKVSGSDLAINITKADFNVKANPTVTSYVGNESKFIDLDNLPLFIQLGLNTTEQSYFYLTGALSVSVSILGGKAVDLSAYCMAKVKVEDTTTKAYIYILAYNKQNNSSASTNPYSTDGFYATEFFISDDMAYTCQTTCAKKSGSYTTQSKNMKISKDELFANANNAVYYMLNFMLNIESANLGTLIENTIYDQIGSSSSDITISHDYSKFIDSATYDSANSKFSLISDLGNIIDLGSIISFNKIGVAITHTSDGTNLLNSIVIGSQKDVSGSGDDSVISILGGIKVKVKLAANYFNGAKDDITPTTSRYNQYLTAFKGNTSTSGLDYYKMTSISAGGLFAGFKPTLKNNGQYVTFTYDSTNSVFFSPYYTFSA